MHRSNAPGRENVGKPMKPFDASSCATAMARSSVIDGRAPRADSKPGVAPWCNFGAIAIQSWQQFATIDNRRTLLNLWILLLIRVVGCCQLLHFARLLITRSGVRSPHGPPIYKLYPRPGGPRFVAAAAAPTSRGYAPSAPACCRHCGERGDAATLCQPSAIERKRRANLPPSRIGVTHCANALDGSSSAPTIDPWQKHECRRMGLAPNGS